MSTDDRNERRERAMNLFQAEEREQQLASIALRKIAAESKPLTIDPTDKDPLRALNRVSEANIADTYNQLAAARTEAARLAASDPELMRLNAALNGTVTITEKQKPAGDIVDAEYVVVPDAVPSEEVKA